MRNHNKIVRTVLAALIYFALTAGNSALAEDQPIVLGGLLCLTGDCAGQGNDALRGAKLAIDEINSKGGVLGRQFKLSVQDTQEGTSGAKAVGAYKMLRTDRSVKFLLGTTWTPAALALAPLIQLDKDVLAITPSVGAPEFHKSSERIFNIRGTDEAASRRAARYAIEKGFNRIAVFGSQQPWDLAQSEAFADECKRLGCEVTIKIDPLPTVSDVAGEALKIVNSKPDAVFIASMLLMSPIARELTNLNYKGSRIASYIDDARIKESKGGLENALFFTFQNPTAEFKEKFMAHYKEPPFLDAATGYDAVYAISHAIRSAGSLETAAVAKAFSGINFNGASGKIEFDVDGCVKKDVVLMQVQNAQVQEAKL